MSGSQSSNKAALHTGIVESLQNISEAFHPQPVGRSQPPAQAPMLCHFPTTVPMEITLSFPPQATYLLPPGVPRATPGLHREGRRICHLSAPMFLYQSSEAILRNFP